MSLNKIRQFEHDQAWKNGTPYAHSMLETHDQRMRRLARGVWRSGLQYGGGKYFNPRVVSGTVPHGAGHTGRHPEFDQPTPVRAAPEYVAPVFTGQGGAQRPAMSSMNPSNTSGVIGYSGSGTVASGAVDPTAEATRQAISAGNQPNAPRMTPQQQAQAWGDANVLAESQLAGGEKPIPNVNMFGGGRHLDSVFYYNGRTEENAQDYDVWQKMTKDAARTIDEALARRRSIPQTMQEAREFVESLPVDDRVGEFAEQYVTGYIAKANPALHKEIIGKAKVRDANNDSFVDWYRMYSGDPEALRLTPEDIMQRKTPEVEFAFEQDPRSIRYGYNPATQQIMQLPPRQMSTEEAMMQKRDERDYERQQRFDDSILKMAEARYQKMLEDGFPAEKAQEVYDQMVARLQPNDGLQPYDDPNTNAPMPVFTPEQAMKAAPGTRFMDPAGNIRMVPEKSAPAAPTGRGTMTGGGQTVTYPAANSTPVATQAPAPSVQKPAVTKPTPQPTEQVYTPSVDEIHKAINQDRALQGLKRLSPEYMVKNYGREHYDKMIAGYRRDLMKKHERENRKEKKA